MRAGEQGKGNTFKNFPQLASRQTGKKERGWGEGIFARLSVRRRRTADFCPPPAAAGSQKSASGFSRKKVRILSKRHSKLKFPRMGNLKFACGVFGENQVPDPPQAEPSGNSSNPSPAANVLHAE